MTVSRVSLSAIEKAIHDVCLALEERGCQSPSWTTMTEDDLWRELVACILGSRVRFETAHSAVERMARRRLLCEPQRSKCFEEYEHDVKMALSEVESSGAQGTYPFIRTRANQIRQAAERFYGCRETVRAFLENSRDDRDARRWLALEVSGIGPKQASLFLRNIGYTTRVAVLDVHILTYMSLFGLTEAPVKSISTIRKYEALEEAFIEHACSCGHAPDCFDLAVWVVLRVAKEEQRTWGLSHSYQVASTPLS
jgi:N-glycosylase/DNA lyase